MSDILRAATYVQKGGVAKTTSTAHMAVAAAQNHDLDVVLLDLAGTQNDLAAQFGLDEASQRAADGNLEIPVSAVFSDEWGVFKDHVDGLVDDMTFDTGEGPDLIPADEGLSGADNDLASVDLEERFQVLDPFISEDLAEHYDAVFIDLPGAENNVSLNGLYAAENVVAPLRPGRFELDGLDSLEATLEDLRNSETSMPGREPRLQLVLPTMIRHNVGHSKAFATKISEEYPAIAGMPVRESANVGDLQSQGRTLFDVDPAELYPTGRAARQAWREATDDLLERVSSS